MKNSLSDVKSWTTLDILRSLSQIIRNARFEAEGILILHFIRFLRLMFLISN